MTQQHEIIAATQLCIGDVLPYALVDRPIVGIAHEDDFIVVKFPENVDWHLLRTDRVKVVR